MRTLIATLIALMLFATTPVAAGDWEDGSAAHKARDYQKAFRLWKRAAEQGDASAQFMVGLMYASGSGTPEDDAKAVYWYTRAAKQGDAYPQQRLGLMYSMGEGVSKNYVHAYAWASIAAAQGNSLIKMFKNAIADPMTPAEIAAGQRLSSELWEKYLVPFQKK